MATISTAVGIERVSRVSGYRIKKGFFNEESANLPQVVAVFGEANSANQSGLSLTKREITSSDEAGQIYGYGSPIHQIMRILRPIGQDGIGGIPTIVFPQISAVGATPTTHEISVTGPATANAVHTLRICGRENLDFDTYNYSIVKDQTAGTIAQNIVDTVNAVLGCPFTAAINDVDKVIFTTKWSGLTSADATVEINNNGTGAGVTYANVETVNGTGLVDIQPALDQFGNDWYTAVINPYELQIDVLETFNGINYLENPTGRYSPTVFKPFMAYFGTTISNKTDLSDIANDGQRSDGVTTVICVAPNSKGLGWEAAANAVRLFTRTVQDAPETDVNNKNYPDMPIPFDGIIGDMSDYNNRDFLVKKGVSTVSLEKGVYKIQDLVTTYHVVGENPQQFSYCRNLNLDWNIYDAYNTLEAQKLRDKVLVNDNQVTDSLNAIKPKEWKSILFTLFDELGSKALINDVSFSKSSLQVQVSSINPNRFETSFAYKRTGIARIESTDVTAGF